MDKNPTAELAAFASTLSSRDIPDSAIEQTKRLLIDAVGCALTGDLGEETDQVAAGARDLGDGTTSVIGTSERLSPVGGTLLNAYRVTAVTVCDVYQPAHCHITPLVIPPALAIAEERQASGSDLLNALAAGLETAVRVAAGLKYPAFRGRGWHAPGVVGPFGSAAAVGRLLGLDGPTMNHAFGLAGSQSAGTYASWGTPAVKFHQARGAVSGLIAARLAAAGFPAGEDALTDSAGGLLNVYSDGGDPQRLTNDLGGHWELEEISLRLWPGATPVQAMLTALFELLSAEDVGVDDVATVDVFASPSIHDTHKQFGKPRGTFEALLSYPYLVSVVLHDRKLWFDQVRAPRYDDATLAAFTEHNVTLRPDDGLALWASRVEVSLKDGRTLAQTADAAKGTPGNPLTDDELAGKFHRCADPTLGGARAATLLERLLHLEQVDDVSGLSDLLRPE